MIRFRFDLRLWLAVFVVICGAAAPASALPPDADAANWKGKKNNCYNYGINEKDDDFKQPGDYPFGGPGEGDVWALERWCSKMDSLARADGLVKLPWSSGQAIPTPGTDSNLVALGVVVGGKGRDGAGDYHWWRKNGDLSWSHKRGQTDAKTTYTDNNNVEQPLTDPRDSDQTDGYTLCGFYAVAKSLDVPTQVSLPPPPNAARVYALVHAGIPDDYTDFIGPRLTHLYDHLPTFSPSNQVPDPLWVNPDAGGLMGLGVEPGSPSLDLPPYMRVYNGVVAVHQDPDGQSILFYNDDRGLEAYLLNPIPATTPWALGALASALTLAGAFVAHRRARRGVA